MRFAVAYRIASPEHDTVIEMPHYDVIGHLAHVHDVPRTWIVVEDSKRLNHDTDDWGG